MPPARKTQCATPLRQRQRAARRAFSFAETRRTWLLAPPSSTATTRTHHPLCGFRDVSEQFRIHSAVLHFQRGEALTRFIALGNAATYNLFVKHMRLTVFEAFGFQRGVALSLLRQ